MRRFSLQCAQSLLFVAPLAVLLLVGVAPAHSLRCHHFRAQIISAERPTRAPDESRLPMAGRSMRDWSS